MTGLSSRTQPIAGSPLNVDQTSVAPSGPPGWAALEWDVVVIGGGNAALVSALAAGDAGARVLIIESAPHHMRGGNTRHTRNIRCVSSDDLFGAGTYAFEELWQDLCNVGEGPNDEALAELTVRQSESMPAWMQSHGVRWQPPLAGTLHLGRTNRFFLGGGKAMLNSYYRAVATRPRITISYDTALQAFEFDGPVCRGAVVSYRGAEYRVRARAFVCAAGGFEANREWLRRYWGDAVDNYIIRGTPYNDGHVLAQLYAANAASAGQRRGFHAIAVDARALAYDGGIATRLDTVPFGIVLNKYGKRFYDEGEDIWPKRYAMWGTHIANQDDQIAYSLWDCKSDGLFLPPMFPVTKGQTIDEVLRELGLDQQSALKTISDFNAGVVTGGTFDPSRLDDCHTEGVTPPKTHWARRLDTPPYYGIAMRPGITFTYRGVRVGADARIVHEDGTSFTNLYAAGEIMSGNILSTGYLAGFGITIGSVWGRIAGEQAARHVG